MFEKAFTFPFEINTLSSIQDEFCEFEDYKNFKRERNETGGGTDRPSTTYTLFLCSTLTSII